MIDLHILTIPGREKMLEKAIISADRPEIKIHIIKQSANSSINAGRAIGYAAGYCNYVACLDDDDIITGSLQDAVDLLEANKHIAAAYYDELIVDSDGNEIGINQGSLPGEWNPMQHLEFKAPHHIAVIRREAIEPHLDLISKFSNYDIFLSNSLIMDYGPLKHIEKTRYNWTIHKDNTHIKLDKSELALIYREINKSIIPAIRRNNSR